MAWAGIGQPGEFLGREVVHAPVLGRLLTNDFLRPLRKLTDTFLTESWGSRRMCRHMPAMSQSLTLHPLVDTNALRPLADRPESKDPSVKSKRVPEPQREVFLTSHDKCRYRQGGSIARDPGAPQLPVRSPRVSPATTSAIRRPQSW